MGRRGQVVGVGMRFENPVASTPRSVALANTRSAETVEALPDLWS